MASYDYSRIYYGYRVKLYPCVLGSGVSKDIVVYDSIAVTTHVGIHCVRAKGPQKNF